MMGGLFADIDDVAVQSAQRLPGPYSHGYLYGGSSYALSDAPYPADLQAAAKAGTLKPNDDKEHPSYATAAGGVISTADDLATWMRALVGGKVLDADYQRQWIESPEPQDPGDPGGQKYGYISDYLWAEQCVFSRRRDAWLQLVHGLRSSQRCNSDSMDQPDSVTCRPANTMMLRMLGCRRDSCWNSVTHSEAPSI